MSKNIPIIESMKTPPKNARKQQNSSNQPPKRYVTIIETILFTKFALT